jgi:hypothetical protein
VDILEIVKTIKEDWAILVFVFGLGAAWFQGKMWFKGVNDTLDTVRKSATDNGSNLAMLNQKMDHLHDRVGNLESTTKEMLSVQHDVDVKLAVLSSKKD